MAVMTKIKFLKLKIKRTSLFILLLINFSKISHLTVHFHFIMGERKEVIIYIDLTRYAFYVQDTKKKY